MPRFGENGYRAPFHHCRSWFTAVVVVLLFLSLRSGSLAGTRVSDDYFGNAEKSGAARTLTSTATPAAAAAPMSLQEACHTEMKLYCTDHEASRLRCLVEQYDRTTKDYSEEQRRMTSALYSDVCESWLAARKTCLDFVHKRGCGLCGSAASDARDCLRQIPPLVLPHACVTSAYYESVRLVGKLRQHQSADARLRLLREALT
ncbi:hypothetical protein LSCM1_00068 [Leishmania martiniquensis]|uniref:Enriched in surface-labeled proteome protein 18 n=1 Tax=Leishmania martiniquensis TaxID=1580590 RepID=A0A836KAN8_9TRYP|nr:hypothetical protein LSCM1_00068 [Leishmania martiniquensis]